MPVPLSPMCAPGLAPSGCRGSGTLLYEMVPRALSNTSSHLVPAGSVARGGRPQGFAASSGGPDPPLALRPRAMVQNCCRQIEAVACQLLPALQSQEVRARKVSMLILNEVGPGGGRGNPQPTQNPPLAASVPIRTRPRQDLSLTPPPLFPTLGLLAGSPASRPPQPLPASPWPAGLRALAVGQAPRLQLSPSSLPPPTVKLTGGGRGWQVQLGGPCRHEHGAGVGTCVISMTNTSRVEPSPPAGRSAPPATGLCPKGPHEPGQ